MAGRSGTLEDSHSAVSVKLSWSSTQVSGNTYSMDFELQCATDGYGTRSSCWYWVAINGSRIVDSSVSITGDGYHDVWHKYGYSITVPNTGKLSSLEAGFGYYSETYGTKEAVATKTSVAVGDANYTITYYKNDSSGSVVTSQDGYKENGSHTVISTSPSHSSNSSNDSTFTITGKANGGNADVSVTATKTETVKYTFLGWSTSSSASSASYTSGNTITMNNDVNLYAVWRNDSSTTYKNNALSNLTNPIRDSVGTSHTVTLDTTGCILNSSTKIPAGIVTNYTFKGWGSNSSSTTALDNSTTYTSDKTVYAIWTSSQVDNSTITLPSPTKSNDTITYTITLHPGSGTVNPTTVNPKKVTSYTFDGWSTNGQTSGKVSTSYTPTADITLYPLWTSSTSSVAVSLPTPTRTATDGSYTITLNANGGTCSQTSMTAGSTTAYTFDGWSTVSGSNSNIISNQDSYTASADGDLYAIWSSYKTTGGVDIPTPTRSSKSNGSYTVTLNPVDGTVSTKTLTANRYIRYTFVGWSTNTSSSGVIDSNDYKPTSNVTLTAIWSQYNSTSAVSLPNASKTDHTFMGWSVTEGSGSYVSKSYTPSSNITLYANYISNFKGQLYVWFNGEWHLCQTNVYTGSGFNECE